LMNTRIITGNLPDDKGFMKLPIPLLFLLGLRYFGPGILKGDGPVEDRSRGS